MTFNKKRLKPRFLLNINISLLRRRFENSAQNGGAFFSSQRDRFAY